MIKSSLIIEEADKTFKFPALYTTVNNIGESNFTVLFTNDHTGTVVHAEKNCNIQIGSYSKKFVSCDSEEDWKRLNPGSYVMLVQE